HLWPQQRLGNAMIDSVKIGLCAVVLGALSLPALAQDNPTLTVYTYDAFAADWGPAPALKEAFEAECACTLEFIAADSSIGALRRAQLEGEGTEADIVLGLDTATIGEGKASGLFIEHGIQLPALDIPLDWTDEI